MSDEGVKSPTEIVVGRLHESFNLVIQREKVEMLVLGFKSHAFRRSSSERLIKGLKTPVLVVRGKKTEAAAIGTVRVGKNPQSH